MKAFWIIPGFALMALFLSLPAIGQIPGGGVYPYGPITPGNCADWHSPWSIEDAGIPCGSGSANYVPTLRDIGMACDGVTDDSVAFRAAILNGNVALDGLGWTCAVSGNFTLKSNTYLHNFTLLQLTPNAGSVRTLTTSGGTTADQIYLDHISINRNGSPSQGTVGNDAGMYFTNVTNLTLIDPQVYGDGRGDGIFITGAGHTCNHVSVVNPYVHDIRWTANSDPGTEQAYGVHITSCSDSYITNPKIANLLSNIAGAGYTAYQSTGINFANDTNVSVFGGTISFVGQGTDATGSGVNRNIWIFGTTYEDNYTWSQKWAHDVAGSGSVGAHSLRAGLGALDFDTGSTGDAFGPHNMRVYGFVAIDTASSGVYSASNTAGVNAAHSGTAGSIDPTDVICDDCTSTSTFAKYSFRNEPTTNEFRLTNPIASGATIADYTGFTAGRINQPTDGTFHTNGAAVFELNTSAAPNALTGAGVLVSPADGVVGRVQVNAYGAISAFSGARYDGTNAAKTAVQANDQVTGVNAYAYDGTNLDGPIASFRTYATDTITAAHWGSKACIATSATNTTTLSDSLCQFQSGGINIGSPTGGDEGSGTLNATALYEAGTSLALKYAPLASPSFTGAVTITSTSAAALAVGANGATNAAFIVDASTASSATGLQVKSAAAAGGLAVRVISSGSNENLTINAKGSGSISLGNVSTGTVSITNGGNLSSSNGVGYAVRNATTSITVPAFVPNRGTNNNSGLGGNGTSADLIAQNVNGVHVTSTTVEMPTLAASSSAQTGTVCWTTGTGNLTVDTTTTCLLSLEETKDIKSYLDPMAALNEEMKLKPFWFSYKPGGKQTDFAVHAGLGAHQVEGIDKRLVGYDPKGKLQGVRYADSVTSLNVAAIQGLQAEFITLRARVSGLEKTVANDNKQIAELRRQIRHH